MTKLMLSLVCEEVMQKQYDMQESQKDCDFNVLFNLSKKHDLAHIVASALEKKGLLPKNELGEAFKRQKLLAIYRRNLLDITESQICSLFDEAKIDYIPLKGAVLKMFYPESWMRTSCDIDILIHKNDKDSAIALLSERLGFNQESDGEKDCSLISKNGVNLELHFSICGEDENCNNILERVWDYSKNGNKLYHRHILKNEFFVFYHIAHMKTHFLEGGCGVRPFIDLWLYRKFVNYSEDKLSELLKEANCEKFYKGVISLCEVWFLGAEHSELTESFEKFTISGGVYGSRENLGSTGKHKKGSFVKYLVSRIFMPREKLKLVYPKIEKYPILIPFYQVKRWFRLFDKDTYNTAKSELSGNDKAEATDYLMKELGL